MDGITFPDVLKVFQKRFEAKDNDSVGLGILFKLASRMGSAGREADIYIQKLFFLIWHSDPAVDFMKPRINKFSKQRFGTHFVST